MYIKLATLSQYHIELMDNDSILTLVYFTSPSCKICQQLKPLLQKAHDTYAKIKVIEFCTNLFFKSEQTFEEHYSHYRSISSLPTLYIIKNREVISQLGTFTYDKLIEEIENYL